MAQFFRNPQMKEIRQKRRQFLAALRLTTLPAFALAVGLSACGVFNATGFIDPVPNGTLLKSASLIETGNPNTAGFVSIWKTDTTTYVVRFESLDLVTSQGAILISVSIGGIFNSIDTLRAKTGTQNYTFTASSSATFVAVKLTPVGNVNVVIANSTFP